MNSDSLPIIQELGSGQGELNNCFTSSNMGDKRPLDFKNGSKNNLCPTWLFQPLIVIFLYSDFRHGQLVNAEPEMTCEDFINSGIYYKHFSQNDSPDKDHQPLIIDLVDKNDPNRLINREMYDLGIHIRSGEKNEPPGVDAESTLILV